MLSSLKVYVKDVVTQWFTLLPFKVINIVVSVCLYHAVCPSITTGCIRKDNLFPLDTQGALRTPQEDFMCSEDYFQSLHPHQAAARHPHMAHFSSHCIQVV